MSVIQFPTKDAPDLFEIIGPFEEFRVLISGRQIPRLTAYRHAEGTIGLTVDGRFGGTFSSEFDAGQAAYLIANALAIGQGYSSMYAENKDRPFAPIARCIGSVETDTPPGARHE